jgi:hypothetical protein
VDKVVRERGRYTKGAPGRPKGAKNVVPGTFKTTLMGIYEKLQQERPELFTQAVTKGLELDAPQNFPYVKMWAEYSEGKPIEKHEHSGEIRLPTKVVIELHRD